MTCPVETRKVDPIPFASHGNLNFKAHDVGWIICGFFTLIASSASFWLIWKHLTYYSCPQQQRHIVRMLFMVPIYAMISTLSYIFFTEAIYYQTIRDCYEAVVIVSFFYLLLQYVGDTPAEQHAVFREVKLKKWFWPLGFWRYRPIGLHFLWLMKICILQYAIVRPACTLIAVGLQYFGLYCLESWLPSYGHIWISLAISISVTVAMYCIIQFYLPIKQELKPYSPVLKFLAVKSVVFLTFWQDSFLSLLVSFGAIKQSEYMTAADIQVGINALLETFEMVIFAFLHIKAFTYVIYRPQDKSRTTLRWKAFLDVLDYRDWWYQMRQTSRYVSAKGRGGDFTIAEDIRRQKYEHLEKALGNDRWGHLLAEEDRGKAEMPVFWRDNCLPATSDTSERREALFEDRPDENIRDAEKHPFIHSPRSEQPVTSLPTLPQFDWDSKPFRIDDKDVHATDDDDDAELDIFIPRKGGRARREGSATRLGAFWRAFRERVSGSQGGAEEFLAIETEHLPSKDVGILPHTDRGAKDDSSLSTAELQRKSSALQAGTLKLPSSVGPTGRRIQVVAPKPLSPFGYQGVAANSAGPMQHAVLHRPPELRPSQIRFSEAKPPSRNFKDDPEAEPVNVSGWVVAGGQSLNQARREQRQRNLDQARHQMMSGRMARSRSVDAKRHQSAETQSQATSQVLSKPRQSRSISGSGPGAVSTSSTFHSQFHFEYID